MKAINGYVAKNVDLSETKFDLNKLARRVKPLVYFADNELRALPVGTLFTFDIESYPNWFLISFREVGGLGRVVEFESTNVYGFDSQKLYWMLFNFQFVSFNGHKFDKYLLAAAIYNQDPEYLKQITDDIIVYNSWGSEIEKKYNLQMPPINHIDVIEVAPLDASLKIYSGRLHCQVMQDLPFDPTMPLTPEEMAIGRLYCGTDLANTELVFNNLAEQIKLRCDLSKEYGLDLRSKSDAQIAEAVINKEIERITGNYPGKNELPFNYSFSYNMPDFVQFETEQLRKLRQDIVDALMGIDAAGYPELPPNLRRLIPIGDSVYQLGAGGLHSTEKSAAHTCAEDETLEDDDVESYYPRCILNQGLFPKHLGEAFLSVFRTLVERRVNAKNSGDKSTADSLKITINGTFGKLGSRYSTLYSPDLLLQTTLSGQLCLLMLIERLELQGISVVSANTDGIVLKYKTVRRPEVKATIAQWEKDCNFKTEETQYMGLYSRDVNNYIAVKRKQDKETKEWLYETDGCKLKGYVSNPWDDPKLQIFRFHKNPESSICSIAAQAFITDGTPLAKTIIECRDVTKFVNIRVVNGGGVYCGDNHYLVENGEFIGKAIRWYYAKGVRSTINYKKSGNKVPKTDGAVPIMDFSVGFPPDIDYQYYIDEAREILYDVGYIRRPASKKLI